MVSEATASTLRTSRNTHLAGDACVLNHGAGVGGETAESTAEMGIDFHDLFDARRL